MSDENIKLFRKLAKSYKRDIKRISKFLESLETKQAAVELDKAMNALRRIIKTLEAPENN